MLEVFDRGRYFDATEARRMGTIMRMWEARMIELGVIVSIEPRVRASAAVKMTWLISAPLWAEMARVKMESMSDLRGEEEEEVWLRRRSWGMPRMRSAASG